MSLALQVLIASTIAMFIVTVVFLVAAWRLRTANNRKAESWAGLERTWGAALARVLAGDAPATSVHDLVRQDERLVFLDYLYKGMSTASGPEQRELYRSLAWPYLPELKERSRTGDPWQRARAIHTVAELARSDPDGVIRAALDDAAPHVALTAARAYARLGLGGIDPVLERLDRYQGWDRRLLRQVLASFGPAAAPQLRACVADRSQPARVRAACADALVELGDGSSNDEAIAIVREEHDVDLRAAALRMIRGPASDAHRYVVRNLCASDDPVVRSQAVACLARIGDDADLTVVERALADLSPWVALNAARGLTSRRGTAVRHPSAGDDRT